MCRNHSAVESVYLSIYQPCRYGGWARQRRRLWLLLGDGVLSILMHYMPGPRAPAGAALRLPPLPLKLPLKLGKWERRAAAAAATGLFTVRESNLAKAARIGDAVDRSGGEQRTAIDRSKCMMYICTMQGNGNREKNRPQQK